jgi:nucleoside-diphosphate-sugar epimerase
MANDVAMHKAPSWKLDKVPMTKEEMGAPKQTVCVTGAAGYLASWVVARLLAAGHTVHAAVRSPEKAEFLRQLPGASERLRVFGGCDLLAAGSFDAAMQGCTTVFHTASPFALGVRCVQRESLGILSLARVAYSPPPSNITHTSSPAPPPSQNTHTTQHTFTPPREARVQAQLIEPAVGGTRNVLESVNRTPSVARVVFTSSITACFSYPVPGKTYTEADWCAARCRVH